MFKINNFKDDLYFIPASTCSMADDDGGNDDGGGGGGGNEGDDKGGEDDKGGGEDDKPGAGLMANAGDSDGEDDKDSGKTLEFKTDKGKTESLAIPEKFWDKEADKMNEPAVLKAAIDAGKTVRQLQNDLAEAKKDGPAGVDKDVPEDAAGYLKDSEGDDKFIIDGKLQLSDDAKNLKPVPIDDPVIQQFAAIAKEEGFSPERFQRIVSKVLTSVDQNAPTLDLEAEAEKFGSNAKAVAGTNKTWADNMKEIGEISAAEHVHLLNMGQTAVGLSVVNKLRMATGGKSIPLGGGGVGGELPSKDEWYKSMPDRNAEPDAYTKWQKQGEEIFGTAPAGSSESGLGIPSNQGGSRSSYENKGGQSNTRGHR